MTQAPTSKRRIDGGSILLAAAIGLLFIWVLSSGACWSLGTGSWSLHNGIMGTLGFMSLLQLALAIYVGFDAHRRGMHGFLWGALVLFTSIVGLVVYLIVCSGVLNQSQADFHQSQAPPQPAGAPGKVCGSCRSPVEPDFKMCPYCGEELDRSCAGCGKKQQSGWQVCPYCGRPAEQ
jgi:RNA polymerase subunit RPABC4/transcription elongation factor Spt4